MLMCQPYLLLNIHKICLHLLKLAKNGRETKLFTILGPIETSPESIDKSIMTFQILMAKTY